MIPHELRRCLSAILRAGMQIRCEGNFCDISEHFVLCKNMKKLCTRRARGKVAVNAA